MKTSSEVGARTGWASPSSLSRSYSFNTVSSDEDVIDEESDNAGVDVGGRACPFRARASACDSAERYEAAEAIGARDWLDRFLNMDGVGEAMLNAMGDGKGLLAGIFWTTAGTVLDDGGDDDDEEGSSWQQ